RPSVPVAYPEVWEEEPSTARLRWQRAYIPRYYSNTEPKYRVEMQEADATNSEWRPVATHVHNRDVTVPEVSPRKDYNFLPMVKYNLEEFKPVQYEAIFLNRPYLDHLCKYVPPRMPIEKPDMIIMSPDNIELTWHQARVPDAIKNTCNLTYTIEVRCPPSFEWREVASGLKVCFHNVSELHPKVDYVFRVRAWNEYGCSEPSLPVSLYRPYSVKHEMDDEEFDREWELRFGAQVPPKLPMDTPRIVTQSADSIWFSWHPARIPAYATQTQITYVVEVKEPPSTQWKRDIAGLLDCQYVREGLDPSKEYHIRVKAETEHGPSEPTLPIILRGKGSRPTSRRSSVERDDREELKLNTTYLDTLTSGASGITYTIEKREPPGHVWTVLAKDVTTTRHEITGLDPERDYMFRVRARNEFGTSDATLPLTLYRDRDDYVPQRRRSRSNSRDSVSQMLAARVGRRSSSFDFGSMRPSDTEPERSSVDRMPVQPEYLATSYDTQYGVWGRKGRISLQIRGHPIPTVHWYKGEEKIQYGDMYNAFVSPKGDIVLEIQSVTPETAGQYKCYAENASGAAVKVVFFELAEPPTILETMKDVVVGQDEIACLKCRVDGFPNPTVKWLKDWRPLSDSAHVRISNSTPETHMLEILTPLDTDSGLYACVVENAAGKVTVSGRLTVEFETVPGFEDVNIRSTPIEEKYHVLEEIGRGRYGVVRRVVEIETGRQFAANFMHMRNKAQKNFFMSEFEVLRKLARTDGVLKIHDAFETDRTLILVTEIITDHELLDKVVSEGDWTEARAAALVSRLLGVLRELEALRVLHLDIKPSNIRVNGDRVKLLGFGVSRVLLEEEEVTHNYGSVGYASPEQGASELEIVQKMGRCEWGFDDKEFEGFSPEARDLITKLLVKDPSKRLSVDECIDHPWLQTKSAARLPTDKLRLFNNAEQLKRETEKVFTSVQLQSFAKILHGTRALYQPAVDIESGEITFPDCDGYGDYLDEDVWYEWQLQYLDDPDSQIFAIRDSSFTVRESRHAGAPKYAAPRTDKRNDVDDIDSGTGVMFRDKLQTTSFWPGRDVTLSCVLAWNQDGEPPVITWYRDETLITDDYRADSNFNTDTGEVSLKVISPKDYDSAVYKCVAHYPSKPGRPLVTSVSGTEAFLTWSPPASVGNTYLLGYRVDYRRESAGERRWTLGPYVTEEYALISGLVPDSTYTFRVSCTNKYGPSPFSSASLEVRTLAADAPKVSPAQELIPFMQFVSFPRQQLILPAKSRRPSLAPEASIELKEQDPAETYELLDTIASHANVISVFDAYVSGSSFYTMYENLTGMNVVQYLCLMKSYKEDLVATLVRQVIDALQYLQFFGIAHLNLQPSSIVMATRRRPFVKLRDFTLARKLEGEKIERAPLLKLSGVSPYGGKELEDTLSRILFDRYDTRDLHENVSKESVKFVTALMRRIPKNRPSVSKCLDSQWLQLSESMTSSRASRSFKSDRLRAFSDRYLAQRVDPHYRADTVDIEKLPKPTAGPLVKPILSDKIVNRYEQMMKKRNMQASLDSFSRETMAAEIALTIESDTPFMDKMAEILDTLPDRKVADTATAKRTVVEVDEGGKDEGIKQKSDKQVETLPSNIVDKSDTILSSKTEEIITKTQDKVDGTAIDASQKMENEFAETKDLEKEKSEVKTDANVKDETDGKSKVAVSQDSMAELKQKEEISKIKKEEVMTQTVIDDARSEIMKTNQTRTSQKVTQKQDEKSLGSDKSKTDQSKNTVEEQSTKTKETSESKPDSKMDATSSLQSSDQQCDAKEGKLEAEAGQNTTEAQQTSNTNMTPTGTVQSSEKTPEITEQNRLKTDEKANEEHSSVTLKEGIDKSELSSETKIDSISPIEKTNVEITSENKISSSLSDSVSTADTDNLQVNANEKISDGVVAKNKVSDGVDTRNENTTANTSDICERSSAELVDASRSGLTTAVDQTKEKSITESPNNHALQEEISPQEANETEKELQTVHNNKPNEHNNAEKNEECIKDNNVDADIKIKQNTNETVGNVKNDKALDDFEIETLNKQQEQKSYDEMQNEAKDTLDTDKCEQSDTQVDLVKDGNISSSNEVDSKRQSADVLKETKVDSLLEREVAEENEKIESPQETGTALQSQLSNKHLEEKSSIVSEQEESIESVKFTENVSKVSDLTKEEDNSEAQDSSTETASGKAEDNQIYNTNKNAIVAEQINAELNTNAVQEVSTDSERVDDSVISTAKEEISKTTTANTSVQEASTEKASSKAVDDQMHEANNDDIIAERNNAELNTNSVQEVSTDYETVDGCVFSMAKEEISNTVTAHAAVEEKQSENVSTMEASREENKSSEEDIFERSVEKQEIVEVSSSVKGKDIELHENKTESIKSDLIASEMNELNAKQTVDETSSDTNVVISKEDVKAKNIKAEISQETGDNEERADISGNATDISSTESGSLIKSQDSALLDTDKTVSEENKSTIKMENTGETILEKSVLESQLESISETSVARRLSKEITVTQVESVDSAHASILQQQDELAKTKNTDLEKRVTESITESSLDVSETVVNSEEQVSVISTEGYNKSVAKEITAQSELVVEKQEDSCANVGQSLDEEPFSIEVISSDKEAQSLQEEFVEKLAESHVIVNEQTKTQVGGEAELSETTVSSTDIAFAETSEALKVTSESSHSTSVSVEQRKETLTSGEATVVENASTAERVIEEISTISSSATNTETILTSETSVEQQKESLIAGGTITADIENLAFEEGITVSNTEQIATEEAETLLETAKVTESRETVREFASNDDELEEMKKEILEDTKILSADCGKYLMGSHEETVEKTCRMKHFCAYANESVLLYFRPTPPGNVSNLYIATREHLYEYLRNMYFTVIYFHGFASNNTLLFANSKETNGKSIKLKECLMNSKCQKLLTKSKCQKPFMKRKCQKLLTKSKCQKPFMKEKMSKAVYEEKMSKALNKDEIS
ncbi:OBSCN-like protein, partial [Mya arenaria]